MACRYSEGTGGTCETWLLMRSACIQADRCNLLPRITELELWSLRDRRCTCQSQWTRCKSQQGTEYNPLTIHPQSRRHTPRSCPSTPQQRDIAQALATCHRAETYTSKQTVQRNGPVPRSSLDFAERRFVWRRSPPFQSTGFDLPPPASSKQNTRFIHALLTLYSGRANGKEPSISGGLHTASSHPTNLIPQTSIIASC